MVRIILLVLIVTVLFISTVYILRLAWQFFKEKPPKPLNEQIKMEVKDNILHFRKETFWNQNDFLKILKYKDDFAVKEINVFKHFFINNDRNIVNLRFEFDEAKKITILYCDAKGINLGTKYDFDWFLKPLNLKSPYTDLEKIEKPSLKGILKD